MILLHCMHMVRLFSCVCRPNHPLIPRRNLALVTGQLSKEIREVGEEFDSLFGVLNEDLLQLR